MTRLLLRSRLSLKLPEPLLCRKITRLLLSCHSVGGFCSRQVFRQCDENIIVCPERTKASSPLSKYIATSFEMCIGRHGMSCVGLCGCNILNDRQSSLMPKFTVETILTSKGVLLSVATTQKLIAELYLYTIGSRSLQSECRQLFELIG
jgi:hypothetical protein